jgi:uncharacterized membrane protein
MSYNRSEIVEYKAVCIKYFRSPSGLLKINPLQIVNVSDNLRSKYIYVYETDQYKGWQFRKKAQMTEEEEYVFDIRYFDDYFRKMV